MFQKFESKATMAVAAQFPDEELLRLGRGVCLIEIKDCWKGTGFHYGNGWIMSNAHNFQDDKDKRTVHSKISSATFTFLTGCIEVEDANITFVKDGKDEDANFKMIRPNSVVFGPQQRTAFIHHLNPGPTADFTNKDIAMIKLGSSYEKGRKDEDFERWERDEKKLLTEIEAAPFAEVQPPEPKDGEVVYGIHFGAPDDNEKFVRSFITPITQAANDTIPMICYDTLRMPSPLDLLAAQ